MSRSPRPRRSKQKASVPHRKVQEIKQRPIKIAVCSFQGRVCPRFDITGEILIFDPGELSKGPLERIDTSTLTPEQRIELLLNKGVRAVMVGGIQEKFLNTLDLHGIRVIWGIIGQVEEAIQAYRQGSLYPQTGIAFSVASDRSLKTRRRGRRKLQ